MLYVPVFMTQMLVTMNRKVHHVKRRQFMFLMKRAENNERNNQHHANRRRKKTRIWQDCAGVANGSTYIQR